MIYYFIRKIGEMMLIIFTKKSPSIYKAFNKTEKRFVTTLDMSILDEK